MKLFLIIIAVAWVYGVYSHPDTLISVFTKSVEGTKSGIESVIDLGTKKEE